MTVFVRDTVYPKHMTSRLKFADIYRLLLDRENHKIPKIPKFRYDKTNAQGGDISED